MSEAEPLGDSVPLSLRQAIRDDIEEEDDQVITMATTASLIFSPLCRRQNPLATSARFKLHVTSQ